MSRKSNHRALDTTGGRVDDPMTPGVCRLQLLATLVLIHVAAYTALPRIGRAPFPPYYPEAKYIIVAVLLPIGAFLAAHCRMSRAVFSVYGLAGSILPMVVFFSEFGSDIAAVFTQTAPYVHWVVLLAIALAGPTAMAFCCLYAAELRYRCDKRSRYPAGHCRECGYDLTGNVSGVCPECGTKIESP